MDNESPWSAPSPLGRPLLALSADRVHLTSPRGEAAQGTFTLFNRGEGVLEGVIEVRLGQEWLRAEPATLRLAAGQKLRVTLHADPATLSPGYTQGEVEVVSNGGAATVPVRLGLRTGRSWGVMAGIAAACLAVIVLVAVAAESVRLPAAAPATTPRATALAHHQRVTATVVAPTAVPTIDRAAALAAIRDAMTSSNSIWQSALTLPSIAALATIKTGPDLARAIAEARDLMAHGEHWEITVQRFQVLPGLLGVSDDGQSGWGIVEKTERRALYGPDRPRAPYEDSEATYRLRYHLVYRQGRWLVDDVAVLSVTPIVDVTPLSSVEAVTARVLPVVMHVEADSPGMVAVGTGIVIRSSSSGSDIITNDHVVSGASTVKLQRWDSVALTYTSAVAATGWREDAADDLAVIHIKQGNLPVAIWGNSEALQPGQEVVAVGYAENLAGGPTVTDGIVSSLLRTAPGDNSGRTYIGHSATINHGNSGGPLADMSGHIVGINTWTLQNTQGLFFAIPSTRAARVAAGFVGTNG